MLRGIQCHKPRDKPGQIFDRRGTIHIDPLTQSCTRWPDDLITPQPRCVMRGSQQPVSQLSHPRRSKLDGYLWKALYQTEPEGRRV